MTALILAVGTPLALMLGVSLWNAATAPRLRRQHGAVPPRLGASLLIPARDEADAIGAALVAAARHPGAHEILVLDDESTDGTADIIRRLQWETHGRIRLCPGGPLPAGWLGKNRACHELARLARGDVLVFCDADVIMTADAVAATIALMEETGADVLSALPAQRYSGWWDRAMLPLILHFPLLGTLPLSLVSRVRNPSLAFGNGQWLAFRRTAYHSIGGHEAVRGDVVEDMALVRLAKTCGLRVVAALGADVLRVHMYRSRADMRTGFAKNLYPLLGGRPVPAAGALLLFAWLTCAPLVLAAYGAYVPLALLVGVRAVHAHLARTPLRDLLLHPVGVVLACLAAVRSIRAHRAGVVTWKSRSLEETTHA